MAISPNQIPHPADAEAQRWEVRIDKRLSEAFSSENPPKKLSIRIWSEGTTIVSPHRREVAAKLLASYQAKGWNVRLIDESECLSGDVLTFYPTLVFTRGGQELQTPAGPPIDDDCLWTRVN